MKIGGRKPSVWGLHLIALIVVLAGVIPFIYTFSLSFKSVRELSTLPPSLIPHKPVWDNYRYVIGGLHGFGQAGGAGRLFTLYRNTIMITLSSVFLTVLATSLAGYALARFKFRGRDTLFFLFIALSVFPIGGTFMAQYELMLKLHLRNTFIGLILLYSTRFGIPLFFMRQVFLTIPSELEEAARVDGASDFRIWLQIMMPLATGGLALGVVIKFLLDWGEGYLARMMMDSADKMTLAWGIGMIMPRESVAAGVSADAIFATMITFFFIPTLLLFISLQKWFIRGALEGLKL